MQASVPTSRSRLLLTLLVPLVVSCAAPRIGGPVAPADDPGAGQLTLPSGHTFAVYPEALSYSGVARYVWPDGRVYEGAWLEGRPQGIGTEILPDGEIYTGTWHDGRRQGHGELTSPDGSQYVGDFEDGQRDGEGTLREPAGLYRGQWQGDVPHGDGDYHGNDGSHYAGQWEAGRRSGYGTYTAANGDRYEGDWVADRPHGFGHLTEADGSEYRGHWESAERSGYGRAVFASGLVYEGTWVKGRRAGFGRENRPDGSSYEGEWRAGKRHGQGREDNPDGTWHRGTWEQNQPLGPGERREWSGIEISGVWNGDLVSSGLLTLPSGPSYAGPLYRAANTGVSPKLRNWIMQTAAAGDPYAQLLAGQMYLDYAQPPPDPGEARRWLEQAAAAGLAEARFRLAMTWTAENPSRAVALLAAAADDGHPEANAVLGEGYRHGTAGLPKDHRQALRYLEQGMRAGSLSARNGLARLLATSPAAEVRDPERALATIRPIALFTGSWQYLDTLAAAAAAAGDYAAAVDFQQQALDATGMAPSPAELEAMGRRLALYQAQEPYLTP